MEKEICKDYLETRMGIETLAYKYHVGKLKIKKILSDNGIEIKKRGNQKSNEKFVVSDWRIEKYKPVEGMEYIVYDPKTGFKTRDIKNEGGFITSYLKKAYNLTFPTLYDRRKYYMQTGNYWWEQWLLVKCVPIGSVSVEQCDWQFAGNVEDKISDVVSNRIRGAKKKHVFIKKTAKVSKTNDGVKKTKQELFVEKAQLAHPDENLDYSQSVYVDKSTPVYIIDHDLRPDGTEYGGYWQRPENHLRGTGHPDKFRDKQRERKRYGWDEMVAKFKEAHPDENIEYPPQENYTGLSCKIRFIDHDLRPDGTEYGEVWQVASEHLKGRKHPRKYFDSRIGSMYKIQPLIKKDIEKKTPTEIFKEKIISKFGDKYILDKVIYRKAKEKVCITCREHGDFWITPNKLLAGQGCYECGREKLYNALRYTRDEVIEKANKVHNNRYTYEHFTEYKNNTSMITVTCPIHGDFKQTVASHLAGCGCPKCAVTTRANNCMLTFEDFLERARKTHGSKYEYIGEYKGYDKPLQILCPIHGEFWQTPDAHIHGCGCQKCGSMSSKAEKEIFDYVNTLGFGKIEQTNHTILDGLEIDVYIPKKKVGIEYNGLYWHSEENGKDNRYHLNKTLKAEEKGVKLIQVFEDEWINHKDIVLSKIRHILGVDKERIKIGARKCIVREITNDESETFLEKWHIQGFGKSTIYYGAYYNDVLVGVMSFKYSEDEWELTRFATNGDYSVPGLGGKIFKRFLDDKNPSYVKSFADRRWTLDKDNNLYTKVGFKIEEICKPDYRYVVGNERKHKFGFRKQILHKKYGVPLEWTEKEMCDTLGFYRIWDCGLIKYVWKCE